MSSKLKLKNNLGNTFTLEHSNDTGDVSLTSTQLKNIRQVDTIADLRAMTDTQNTIWVSGYHTKDDGAFGSHFFRWNPTSTEDDNGGTIIKLDSVATGRYELQYSGAVNVKWFGAKGDGINDDTVAIQSAIDNGGNFICGTPNKTYLITSKIVPLENQTIDFRHSKILVAPGTDFASTDSAIELENDNSNVLNFEIDGNKLNVTHQAVTGTALAGCIVRASNCSVKNFYIHDCITNGIVTYGSNISNILISDFRIEDNEWTAFGNEIPQVGDINAEDIKFINGESINNKLGGVYLAGGKNISIINCNMSDGNRNYFYIGDANGGLINCKVINSKLKTTNVAVSACTVEGEVQTGSESGNRNNCNVSFVNTELISGGGGTGLEINNGAIVEFNNLTIEESSIGVYNRTDSTFIGDGVNINNVSSHGILASSKIEVSNVKVEKYGANQAGIFFNTGSDNSIVKGLSVGSDIDETGRHGVWGVAGLRGLKIHDFKVFNGLGVKVNFTSADLNTWDIQNSDSQKDLTQQGIWNGKALFVGSGYLWIDSTGKVRVKSSIVPPTSDTDGTIVGTQV